MKRGTGVRQHGKTVLQLNDKEMGTLQTFLKTPEYPLELESDYGTFGNNISIRKNMTSQIGDQEDNSFHTLFSFLFACPASCVSLF